MINLNDDIFINRYAFKLSYCFYPQYTNTHGFLHNNYMLRMLRLHFKFEKIVQYSLSTLTFIIQPKLEKHILDIVYNQYINEIEDYRLHCSTQLHTSNDVIKNNYYPIFFSVFPQISKSCNTIYYDTVNCIFC